jgi:hypothetical protein
MITVALIAVSIIVNLFVTRPDLLSANFFHIPQTYVTVIVDEQRHVSSGKNESYEIYTADAKAMRLIIYPQNVDAKLAVNVYYPDEQNKTFEGKEQFSYIVDFNKPLNVEILPEQDSTVIVDLLPFTQSDVDVKISLRYVR